MRYLFFTLLFSFTGTHYAMQTNAPIIEHITFDDPPLLDITENSYVIRATVANGREIGRIRYQNIQHQNTWKLCYFYVKKDSNQDYRRKAIGTQLFKKCIVEIKKQKARLLVWDAMPSDPGLSLESLVIIYKKIVAKNGFAPYALEIGKPIGPLECQKVKMELTLKYPFNLFNWIYNRQI